MLMKHLAFSTSKIRSLVWLSTSAYLQLNFHNSLIFLAQLSEGWFEAKYLVSKLQYRNRDVFMFMMVGEPIKMHWHIFTVVVPWPDVGPSLLRPAAAHAPPVWPPLIIPACEECGAGIWAAPADSWCWTRRQRKCWWTERTRRPEPGMFRIRTARLIEAAAPCFVFLLDFLWAPPAVPAGPLLCHVVTG